ncbi:1249_t:CDS:2, partial [Entrophospora sp. SA101]
DGKYIFKNLPVGLFELKLSLPSEIDCNEDVDVEIDGGIVDIVLNKIINR